MHGKSEAKGDGCEGVWLVGCVVYVPCVVLSTCMDHINASSMLASVYGGWGVVRAALVGTCHVVIWLCTIVFAPIPRVPYLTYDRLIGKDGQGCCSY